MPDDRFIHPRLALSQKVSTLDHLGFRVWIQYLLSADDYGVMLESASVLRGDNCALAKESEAEIAQRLQCLVESGLLLRFDHQGQVFVLSATWQDFQKVRLPRRSYLPIPPPEVLQKCSRETSELLLRHKSISDRLVYRLTANGKRLMANGKEQKDDTPDKQVVAAWHRLCPSLVGVQRLGPERLRHLKARLSEYPSLDWWDSYLSRIEASDFLTGRKPREGQHAHWKATFDWALKPDSIAKVCEGNYDTPTGQARGRTWSEGCQHEPRCTDRRVHDLLLARAQVGE